MRIIIMDMKRIVDERGESEEGYFIKIMCVVYSLYSLIRLLFIPYGVVLLFGC